MLTFKQKKITMEGGFPDSLEKNQNSAIKEDSFMGLDRQVRMQFNAHKH